MILNDISHKDKKNPHKINKTERKEWLPYESKRKGTDYCPLQ